MSDPMFVSLGGDVWVQVAQIVDIEPHHDGTKVTTTRSAWIVQGSPRDFINRIEGVLT